MGETMKYYVYVLKSRKIDRYYIGQTDNIDKRLERHNLGLVRSTKPYCPWDLVYCETYRSRSEAIRRERMIKAKKSKEYLEYLVKRN